jgi:hypothetical protein
METAPRVLSCWNYEERERRLVGHQASGAKIDDPVVSQSSFRSSFGSSAALILAEPQPSFSPNGLHLVEPVFGRTTGKQTAHSTQMIFVSTGDQPEPGLVN